MEMIRIIGLALLICACSGEGSTAQEPTAVSLPDAVEAPEAAAQQSTPDKNCTVLSDLRFANEKGVNLTYVENERFTGKACSYHPNGQVFTLSNYISGARDGVWEVYFENGQLEKKGIVQNGKEHGNYSEYFPDGQQKYDYTYSNGAKVGKWLSWYADGTPYTERNFENDQLSGKVLVWDEQGRLAKEYHYVKGKKVNSIMHFKNFE